MSTCVIETYLYTVTHTHTHTHTHIYIYIYIYTRTYLTIFERKKKLFKLRTKIYNTVLAVYKILRIINVSFNSIQFFRLQELPGAKGQSNIKKNRDEIKTLELLCTWKHFPVAYKSSAKFSYPIKVF